MVFLQFLESDTYMTNLINIIKSKMEIDFDEPYLQYFASEITNERKPFLGYIFTISSDYPYPIPLQYKEGFPKGKAEHYESLSNADWL